MVPLWWRLPRLLVGDASLIFGVTRVIPMFWDLESGGRMRKDDERG